MKEKTETETAKPPGVRKTNDTRKKINVLGPIDNLEEHVRPNWWQQIFNSLYLKTDSDIVGDDDLTRAEVDLFAEALKISPDDHILDLCCGQGRHSLEFARRGCKHIDGLDRSSYLVQRAKTQAKKENLPVHFRVGDARNLPYKVDTFDVVMILGNSFGYFETVQDDLRVLKEVLKVLKPWGRLLIDIADGEYLKTHFQARSWEWLNKNMFVCRERSLSAIEERLISREVVTDVRKGVIADQFYAERLYSTETIEKLLRSASFNSIEFHGRMATDSKRNQDLGMMEQRLVLTAVAKKDWTPSRSKSKTLKNVVVILGDPQKPDPLKPKAVFDDDDFYTIDQLKGALREMSGYNFIYLSNHDTLIQDLIRHKDKMAYAFNLCDEGFRNDATRELHVPSVLELLDIPYTGAGPQCLGHCYDKSLVRGIAREMGIPVPEAFFVEPEDIAIEAVLTFPVIVKPNFGDSSFGITQKSVASNGDELVEAIASTREQFGYNKPLLVEEFLTGKELSVGIIGNMPDSYTVLPIIEEDYSALPEGFPRICSYEAKWLPDSPYWNLTSIEANIPKETEEALTKWSLMLFKRFGCRDYARFDWRLDKDGKPRLLEVNPNPGWCWDGHINKMAKIMGMPYKDLLELILKSAEARIGIQP